jgi:pimeloyl-ACP methyl ester carboxylesterase
MAQTTSAARRFPDAPGQLIDVGGHKLHLNCQGEGGPAVILDAALGASSLSWSLVVPGVAAITRACVYDRAGFGWSDAGPLPRTAGRIADELYELLRRASVPPPWLLVGHSYGGLVMRLAAARHPHKVAGLVLIEPAHPEEWVRPSEEQWKQIVRGTRLCRHGAQATRLGVGKAIAALVGVGALGMARVVVKLVSRGSLQRADENILTPVWKLPPETRPLLRQIWTQPKFFESLGSQIESISESARQVLSEAPNHYGDLPLVVVTGAKASEQRMCADEALAHRSARGRHVIVDNTGHWIPLDAPGAVVDVVLDVVHEIRASRSREPEA